jgi:murein DD-endopeptidase MepM/ murein hydrolase activator NlpD
MSNKKISFLIFTDDDDKPIKILVTLKTILGLIGFLSILIILTITFLVDYGSLLVDSLEKKRIAIENQELKRQLSIVENKLSALDLSLSRSKSFITKLKLITNLEDPKYSLALSQANLPEEWNLKEEALGMVENLDALTGPRERQNQKSFIIESRSNQNYATLSIRIDKAIKETELQEQNMTELWQLLSDRQSLLAATPSVRPSQGWISSLFGYRPNPFTGRTVLHAGIDIAANPGTPIIAPANGVVINAGYDEGYGKVIEIDHGFGLTTRYGHCSQIFVKIGQKVTRFDVIGSVGNTGRSTGAHLHYEVRVAGVPRNPMLYVLED